MINKTTLGAALLLIVLSGCLFQSGPAKLEVTPGSVSFGADAEERRITLSNLGGSAFEWTSDIVVREAEDALWEAGEAEWLELSKRAGSLAPGNDHITLTVDRSQLPVGTYADTGVRIRAHKVERIIPVSLLVTPLLRVNPAIIDLRPGEQSARLTLENRGPRALNWTVAYFEGDDASVDAGPVPPDMVITPGSGALARVSSTTVSVEWSAERSNFGLRFSSPEVPGHDAVVLVRFGVPLADLAVEPEVLRLYYGRSTPGFDGGAVEEPASLLTLRNLGRGVQRWSVTVNPRGEADGQSPDVIQVSPATGELPGGQSETISVRVNRPEDALPGAGNYELIVRVQGTEGSVIVPLILEAVSLPVVIASEPPDPEVLRPEYTLLRRLDFGRDSVQEEFYVVNIGPVESRLFFRIVHDDENAATPLIVDVTPVSGNTNGNEGIFYLPATNIRVNAVRVQVTVNRAAMTEDVEYRKLYIEAWDEDEGTRIDAVPPWQIDVSVERPPMKVEGALNRSRPPFLMRFVFLLRDTLGRVIPTRTPEDLERLRFVVSEDGIPLDLNEVAVQIDGPEQLKVNLVLMLDYTGSMYNAGVDSIEAPRAPGELLDEVRDAAAMFLDDIPPGYRVALMYYNDRQNANRMIHPFSTDRESLKAALRRFRVAPAMHGTSDIWDALTDAAVRLAAEDAGDVLPFDDADVRAVVFVSDGHDNSSSVDATALETALRDRRVRLYPLAYTGGQRANFADLISLAEETGGHFYNAGDPSNLVRLLGHSKSLVLEPLRQAKSVAGDRVEFKVRNAGNTPLYWTIVREEDYPWITDISPTTGTTAAGGESLVSVTVAPRLLVNEFGVGDATLSITSNDGEGWARISMAVADDGETVQNLALSLRDAPGRVWDDLSNQVVLSYVTPLQRPAQYSIRFYYEQEDGREISAYFEEDGFFFPGDVRAGQISMHTTGLDINLAASAPEDRGRAEVYVRADYVPRNVNLLRMRFIPQISELMPDAVKEAFDERVMTVELAPDGLLTFPDDSRPNWRLVPEGDDIYRVLTTQNYPLPYASSGNLLRITFSNLLPFINAAATAGLEPEFFLDMRVDNSVLVAPQTGSRPSETVFFLYPSGPVNPNRPLRISEDSDLAAPARYVEDLAFPGIIPELPGAWDRDEDGVPDFNDPNPDDEFRPGALIRPSVVRFAPGINTALVSIVNNRWDTFDWALRVILPVDSPLLSEEFIWYVEDGVGGWIARASDERPQGTLAPGETALLQLRFEARELPGSTYSARIELDTDVFGLEITPIEAQL